MRASLLILVGAVLVVPEARAQTGTVTGRVTDGATGAVVPGAAVVVEGTARGGLTDQRGRYLVVGLAPGTYRISAQHIGYTAREETVTVRAGETAAADLVLELAPIQLQEVVAQAVVRGQARALMEQRAAPSQRVVISSELMEQFGDYNLLGSLARLPGMTTQWEDGEPQSAKQRGLQYSKTLVTVDGVPLPANHEGHRGTRLTTLSADMVESLELIKAVTPDMDANTLAGTVNLRTRRIYGREPRFRLTSGIDYSDGRGKAESPDRYTPRFSATYSRRFADRVGFSFQGDFRRTHRTEDRLGLLWRQMSDGSYAIDRYEPSYRDMRKDRIGFNGQLDYSFTEDSWIYFRALFAEELHKKFGFDARSEFGRGTYVNPGEVEGYRFRRIFGLELGPERRGFSSFTLGGETRLLDRRALLDFSLNYGHGIRRSTDRFSYEFRYNGAGRTAVDANDHREPRVTAPADAADPANFRLENYETRWRPTDDQNYIADVNLTVPFAARFDGAFKVGARFHQRDNTTEDLRSRFRFDERLWLDQFVGIDDPFHAIGSPGYRFGPSLDHHAFQRFFQANGDRFTLDVNRLNAGRTGENYTTERTYAAYLMPTLHLGALRLIGGVRMEHYDGSARGFTAVFDNRGNWVENLEVEATPRYTDFFPSIHAAYQITPYTIVRAAWTNSISRPRLDEGGISPAELIEERQERITRGNPDLKPERSTKFDLGIEHYLSRQVGLVSGSFFYLSIEDLISRPTDVVRGGPRDGWELRTPINVDEATTWGFELAWQQQLDFLPGALRRLGAFANYTYTRSKVELETPRTRDVYQEDIVPHVVNAALSYEVGRLYGQLSMVHNSSHITNHNRRTIGGVTFDAWERGATVFDAAATLRIRPNARVNFEFKNLTGKPIRDRYLAPAFTADAPDAPRLGEVLRHNDWTGAIALRLEF